MLSTIQELRHLKLLNFMWTNILERVFLLKRYHTRKGAFTTQPGIQLSMLVVTNRYFYTFQLFNIVRINFPYSNEEKYKYATIVLAAIGRHCLHQLFTNCQEMVKFNDFITHLSKKSLPSVITIMYLLRRRADNKIVW